MEPADLPSARQLPPVAIPRRELFGRFEDRARLRVGIVGMDALRHETRVGHDLLRLEAVDVAAAFAGVEHRTLAGRRDHQAIDHPWHVGGHRLIALLALVQRVVSRAASGDVGDGAEIAGERTGAIDARRAAADDPAHGAVGALEAVLQLEVRCSSVARDHSANTRSRSSACSAPAQPAPIASASVRPVRRHHSWLTYSHEPAGSVRKMPTGIEPASSRHPLSDDSRTCPASRQVCRQPEPDRLTYADMGI